MILDTRTCVWYHAEHGSQNRDSVLPSESSESTMTYSRFLELFPDNDACLEYLKAKFFPDGTECPKCGKATKFHRITSRSAYSCQYCRPPGLPDGRNDLPQVHGEPAALVLRDLPNEQHALRDQREAAGARDRRDLQDGSPDVQADQDAALGRGRRGRWRATSRWTRQRAAGRFARATGRAAGTSPRPAANGTPDGVRDGRSAAGDVRAKVVKSTRDQGHRGPDLHARSTVVDDLHGRMRWLQGGPLEPRFRGHRRIKHIATNLRRRRRRTRTPSRGSSGCSRTACGASITRSAPRTCRTTWTSTRSGTTGGSQLQPMFWAMLDRVEKP